MNEQKKLKAAERLLEVMDTLRVKCPWDREQTFESLRNNTIEETYELVDAIADNDTVILFRNGFTAAEDEDTITYKDGTLYVNDDDVKGFDVSPEVKTVLSLSDSESNAFDDVDDSYDGYAGLERAIRNLRVADTIFNIYSSPVKTTYLLAHFLRYG